MLCYQSMPGAIRSVLVTKMQRGVRKFIFGTPMITAFAPYLCLWMRGYAHALMEHRSKQGIGGLLGLLQK